MKLRELIVKTSKLKPMNTKAELYPKTTDEYLLLFVLAGLTKGVSTFKGISDLSNKESSRAYEMKNILKQLGIKSKLNKNEMKIFGKGMFDASDKKLNIKNLEIIELRCAFIIGVLTGAKTRIKGFETVYI